MLLHDRFKHVQLPRTDILYHIVMFRPICVRVCFASCIMHGVCCWGCLFCRQWNSCHHSTSRLVTIGTKWLTTERNKQLERLWGALLRHLRHALANWANWANCLGDVMLEVSLQLPHLRTCLRHWHRDAACAPGQPLAISRQVGVGVRSLLHSCMACAVVYEFEQWTQHVSTLSMKEWYGKYPATCGVKRQSNPNHIRKVNVKQVFLLAKVNQRTCPWQSITIHEDPWRSMAIDLNCTSVRRTSVALQPQCGFLLHHLGSNLSRGLSRQTACTILQSVDEVMCYRHISPSII